MSLSADLEKRAEELKSARNIYQDMGSSLYSTSYGIKKAKDEVAVCEKEHKILAIEFDLFEKYAGKYKGKKDQKQDMWVCADGKKYNAYSALIAEGSYCIASVKGILTELYDGIAFFQTKARAGSIKKLEGLMFEFEDIVLIVHNVFAGRKSNVITCLQYSEQNGGQFRFVKVYTNYVNHEGEGCPPCQEYADDIAKLVLEEKSLAASAKAIVDYVYTKNTEMERHEITEKLMKKIIGL